MVQSSSPPHFAAMLMMLLAGASVVPDGADAHIYRHPRGGNSYNAWPAAFVHHRGADYSGPWKSLFTPAPPRRGRGVLNDVFQELYSGVEQVARELSEPRSNSAGVLVPKHEIVESATALTVYVDLPGCKKRDVDAKISQDAGTGTKTLKISAVRIKRGQQSTENSNADTTHNHDNKNHKSSIDSASEMGTDTTTQSAPPLAVSQNFELQFTIGDGIDASGVRGTLEDGVLTLVLPKVEPEPPAQPIDVPIDPSSDETTGGTEEPSSDDAAGNTHISLS